MLRFIIEIFLIIVLAAVIGIDSCTCGNGHTIRRNLGLENKCECICPERK